MLYDAFLHITDDSTPWSYYLQFFMKDFKQYHQHAYTLPRPSRSHSGLQPSSTTSVTAQPHSCYNTDAASYFAISTAFPSARSHNMSGDISQIETKGCEFHQHIAVHKPTDTPADTIQLSSAPPNDQQPAAFRHRRRITPGAITSSFNSILLFSYLLFSSP